MTGITVDQQEIIDSVSKEIARALNIQATEEHYPGQDPDRMEDTIAYNKKMAMRLRDIRYALENLFSGVCT
jgi:hypothetical protein